MELEDDGDMEPETCFHGIQEHHLQKSRFFKRFSVLTFISYLLPDLSDFVSSMLEIFAGVAGSILCSTSTDIASKVQQHCNMLDTFR